MLTLSIDVAPQDNLEFVIVLQNETVVTIAVVARAVLVTVAAVAGSSNSLLLLFLFADDLLA